MSRPLVMATVADVRCTENFVRALFDKGMRGVRINSAHVDGPTFGRMVRVIRSVSPEIKILMDTKGPEIRTTALPLPLEIIEGRQYNFRSGYTESSEQCVNIRVDELHLFLKPGAEMLVDDGELKFCVEEISGTDIRCRALTGGVLDSCKTVAFTGVEALPLLPAVSERDREMIAVAVRENIDMIAHSFVRSASDVKAVRELTAGSGIQVYAKIECREAVDNLETITAEADGLLVARGDLGTNIPLQEIPQVQLGASAVAHEAGKPLILATQILQSMIHRPQPTRAELSDIALACYEGFDWLLLTGETAQGDYPAECVDILYKTIEASSKTRCKILMTT